MLRNFYLKSKTNLQFLMFIIFISISSGHASNPMTSGDFDGLFHHVSFSYKQQFAIDDKDMIEIKIDNILKSPVDHLLNASSLNSDRQFWSIIHRGLSKNFKAQDIDLLTSILYEREFSHRHSVIRVTFTIMPLDEIILYQQSLDDLPSKKALYGFIAKGLEAKLKDMAVLKKVDDLDAIKIYRKTSKIKRIFCGLKIIS